MVLSVTTDKIEKERSYFYSTQIVDALQDLKEPVEEGLKAKKRRLSLGLNTDGEGTRFILFKETILFDVSGISGDDTLKELLMMNNGFIELPVHILLPKQETGGTMVISITDEKGKRQFLQISCISNQFKEIRAQLEAVAEIAKRKRTWGLGPLAASGLGMELNLRLGAEIEKPFSVQLDFKIDIKAHVSCTARSLAIARYWDHVVAAFFQHGKPAEPRLDFYGRKINNTIITPRDFYDAVTFPPKDKVPSAIQPPDMVCQMLPFQKRTVRWMLQREGFDVRDDVDGFFDHDLGVSPLHFKNVDSGGNFCYVSPLLGVISTDVVSLREEFECYKGGILAEEMGLGKSVELIALISLNKRCAVEEEVIFDHYTEQQVTPTAATLIISPTSILHQWKQELAMHAPHLRGGGLSTGISEFSADFSSSPSLYWHKSFWTRKHSSGF